MRFVILGLAIMLFSCEKKVDTRPNVLFILADDQGWGDMSSHGNTVLETPVLDKLAASGAEFEHFYVSPLCAPTRASLLTGRYHLKTGATSVSNGLEIMDTEETTLAELFKANGYETGIFGKWHNGSHFPNRPTDQGFDEFIGFCAGHLTNYFDSYLDSNLTEIKSKGYITDYLADKVVDFIDRKKDKPFFCYVPFNAPHSPFQVPDAYFDKYKSKGLDDELASIYGMVDNLDFNIGRLLQKLEDEGLAQNTIVIFMTDNGPNGMRFNGNMKGIKGHVDEGGVRVPAIIRWPGKIEAGLKIESIAAHIDWFPTLQQLCGLKEIEGRELDGESQKALLTNENYEQRDRSIFSHVAFLEKELKDHPGTFRNTQYRFVLKENPEVYDMLNDPEQKEDIAAKDTAMTQSFLMEYKKWFAESSKYYRSVKPVEVNTTFVELPAYEASFGGKLKYEEGHGWAHDWLKNWTSTSDQMSWLIKASEGTEMEVWLKYTCPISEIGSEIVVQIGQNNIKAKIEKAYDPPLIPSPDRVKRKEAYEKEWAILKIGKIKIPKGENQLVLKATNVKNQEVAEVMSVVLGK